MKDNGFLFRNDRLFAILPFFFIALIVLNYFFPFLALRFLLLLSSIVIKFSTLCLVKLARFFFMALKKRYGVMAITPRYVFELLHKASTLRRKVTASSYHYGLKEIVIASYSYRSSLIGIVFASYSYRSKVTKSLLLTIMLRKGFTLITTSGFSPLG